MNYVKYYERLIERAQSRVLDSYTETHHIVPRCIGGKDITENLVELTPEEHFLAHQLLVKMYPLKPELVMAVRYMCYGNVKNGQRTNNKMFGWLRRRHAEAMREINTGRKQSEETKAKKSRKMKGRKCSPLSKESIVKRTETRKINGVKKRGSPMSQETKDKISNTLKEKNRLNSVLKEEKIKIKRVMTQEQKDHLSKLNTGKKRNPTTQETKDKISSANQGRKRSDEQKNNIKESLLNRPTHICPHCGISSRSGVIYRYHFDNCKHYS